MSFAKKLQAVSSACTREAAFFVHSPINVEPYTDDGLFSLARLSRIRILSGMKQSFLIGPMGQHFFICWF
jgi:hypothetical protein